VQSGASPGRPPYATGKSTRKKLHFLFRKLQNVSVQYSAVHPEIRLCKNEITQDLISPVKKNKKHQKK
jgi:hypothetical protein